MASQAVRASARHAAVARHHGPDHPDTIAARRELDAANLADHITRIVDAAPPLTADQRERLALLLSPGAGDAAT